VDLVSLGTGQACHAVPIHWTASKKAVAETVLEIRVSVFDTDTQDSTELRFVRALRQTLEGPQGDDHPWDWWRIGPSSTRGDRPACPGLEAIQDPSVDP
jgi:hypothetical protein